MQVRVSEIVEGSRFRQEYGDLTELKNSIERFGIIEPIVLDEFSNLIAGGRRLHAARELGLEEVPAVFRGDVDDLQAREIELEENIHRKDLTWIERGALVAEIDRIKRLRYGSKPANRPPDDGTPPDEQGWTQKDTAVALGVSQPTVFRDLAAARAVQIMPELANEPDRNTALKLFNKRLHMLERELAVREGALRDEHLLLGSCLTLMKTLDAHTIDCCITDPPYGISLEHGLRINYTPHYNDNAGFAIDQFDTFAKELFRVMKPNGHVYIFSSFTNIFEFMDSLSNAGFLVAPVPLIWTKSSEGLVDFDYRYALTWEPIIYCYSRDRRLTRKRKDVFAYASDPSSERATLAQKPLALLSELIEMSTQPGELVADFFFGSGNTLLAAKNLGRKYLGIELNPDMYNFATLALVDELVEAEPEPTVTSEDDL